MEGPVQELGHHFQSDRGIRTFVHAFIVIVLPLALVLSLPDLALLILLPAFAFLLLLLVFALWFFPAACARCTLRAFGSTLRVRTFGLLRSV